MANWYYEIWRRQYGPVPEKQLRDLLAHGTVGPDCPVWTEGMAEWRRASEIGALFPAQNRWSRLRFPRQAPARREPLPPGPTGGTEDFTIGLVFRDALTVLKTQPGTFLLIGLVPLLLMASLAGLLGFATFNAPQEARWTQAAVYFLIAIPLSSLVHMMTLGVVAYAAFQNFCGRRVRFSAAMRQGLRRLLPLLGMGLLGLAALIAALKIIIVTYRLNFHLFGPAALFLFLFVLANILVVILFVSLPACLIEKTGPIASMVRSASLTKGCRWKISAIYLLTMLAIVISSLALGAVNKAILAGAMLPLRQDFANIEFGMTVLLLANLFSLVSSLALGAAQTTLTGVVLAATYTNLRRAEQRKASRFDDVARAFD